MIKNVIYSRVSSESERQDTERQTKERQEYAKTMNYEVVEVLKKRQVDSKRTIKDQFFKNVGTASAVLFIGLPTFPIIYFFKI